MPYEEDEYTKIAREALAQTIPSIQQYQGSLDDMARDMNTAQMIQSGRRQTMQEQQQNISNLRTQLEQNQDLQNQARDAFTKMQTDYTNLTGRTDYQDAIQQNLKTATRDKYDDLAEQILSQYNSPVPSLGSASSGGGGRRSRRTTQSNVEAAEDAQTRKDTMKLKKLQNRSEKRLARIEREQEQKKADAAKYASDQLEKGADLVYKDAVKNGKGDDEMYGMLTDEQKQAVNAKLSEKTDTKKLKKYDGTVQAGKLGPSDLEAEAYTPKAQQSVESVLRKAGVPANAQAKVQNNTMPEEQDNSGRLSIKEITTGAGLQRQAEETKLDRWADPSTKISKGEQEEARETASEYLRQNVRAGRFVGDPQDLEDGTAQKMSIISAKTDPVTAFTNGLVDSFKGVGRILDDLTGNVVSNTINRLSGKTAEEAEEFNQNMMGAARTQHPIITGAGTMGGKMMQYAGVNSALEALGVTPALEAAITGGRDLGAAGNALAGAMSRLATGELADVALDTIPTEYENWKNGMSPTDIAQDTLKNLNTNMMYNIGGEVVGRIPELFKNADAGAIVNNGSLRGITQSIQPDAVNIPSLESTFNPLENVSNAMRNLDDIANQTGDVYTKEGVQQLSDALASGENLDEAANALKQTLQNNGVDPSTVDAVTQNMRTYDSIDNMSRAQELAPDVDFTGAQNAVFKFEADKARYANGEISLDELKASMKEAQDSVYAVNDAVNEANTDAAEVERLKGVLSDIKKSIGKESGKGDVVIQIKESDLDAIKGKGGRDKALERLNKQLSGTKIKLTLDGSKAHNALSGDDLNNLLEQVADYKKALHSAKTVDSGLANYAKGLYLEYDEIAQQAARGTNATAEELKEIEELFGPYEPNYAKPANQPEIPSMNRSVAEAIDNGEESVSIDARQMQQPEEIPPAEPQAPSMGEAEAPRMEAPEGTRIPEDATKSSGNTFGEPEIPEGELERGFAESMRERGNIPDEIKQKLTEKPFTYKQLGNKQTAEKATNLFKEAQTFDDAEKTLAGLIQDNDPTAALYAKHLVSAYSETGQTEAAMKVMDQISEAMTKRGQFTQAAVLALAKDDPMTALEYAQRQIGKLNKDGAARYGRKWKDFSLNEEELKAFGELKPGDEKGIKDLFDKVGERIGKDYPATLGEKLIEGRRVAMLFNVRTNVRNLGANVPTEGMRYVSDRIEGLGQKAYKLFHPDYEPSAGRAVAAGINDAQSRSIASEVWNSEPVQALVNGDTGKYSDPNLRGSIMQNRQMFKGTAPERFLDKITNGGIQKINKKLFGKEGIQSIPETVRNATYGLLELGDNPFVKANFEQRLASYIKASDIKSVDQVPQEAIDFAWEEAMKATYKDNSWAMSLVSGAKNAIASVPGIGKPLSDAVIPFVQAPANIAARMVDYSPIRGTKGLADIIQGSKNVDYDQVTKGIEELSKGLTGGALIAAGIALHNSGLITGSYSEDKDERAAQKRQGFREYALHVGDKYFTYDWAQPFAQSLIMGTILADSINQSDKINDRVLNEMGEKMPVVDTAGTLWATGTKAAKASVNSWFNASPLQSLAELIGTSGYGSYEADLGGGIEGLVEDYPMSFIPSVLGATARGTDPTVRNTTDKTSKLATLRNQAMSRIPGLSNNLPASYDTWGEEYTRGNSVGESMLSQFLVPGEFTRDTSTDKDKEIDRVFKATDENKVFPRVADSSVDGRTLTNREYSDYQRDMGQRNAQLIDSLFNQDFYAAMDDKDKADTIASLYSFSKGYSENALFDKDFSSANAKLAEVYDNAGGGEAGANALVTYMNAKSRSTNDKGNVTIATAVQTLSQMSPEEQAANAQYLITSPSEKALNAAERFDNGLYKFYAIQTAAIGTDKGATAISQERLQNLLNDDEALAAVNGGQTMTQEEKAAWYDTFYPDAKSGNPYGEPAQNSAGTAKKETTKEETTNNKQTVHYQKPDRSKLSQNQTWDAYGFDREERYPDAQYERFQHVPGLGDYSKAAFYNNYYAPIDVNNNHALTKSEVTNWVEKNYKDADDRRYWFNVMGYGNWKNPY